LCNIVAACVSGCGVCTECRAAARHSVHTHHNLKHMLPQYCTTYNDVISTDYLYKSVTLARLSISSLKMVRVDRKM